MSNNINWMGNRALDQNSYRQAPQSNTSSVPMQQSKTAMPSVPIQQGSVSAPAQQGGSAFIPTQQGDSASYDIQQGPPPSTEKGYIPYYLAGNIGKNVRAEFIIGSTQYTDKTGVLSEVGINYFVLYDVNSHANIMCDLYSVKFVTILV